MQYSVLWMEYSVLTSQKTQFDSIRNTNRWMLQLLKLGLTACPETSVENYHSTLRHIPEERRSHLHRGGSLKWRETLFVYCDNFTEHVNTVGKENVEILVLNLLVNIGWKSLGCEVLRCPLSCNIFIAQITHKNSLRISSRKMLINTSKIKSIVKCT
jgi:hypothetical protein